MSEFKHFEDLVGMLDTQNGIGLDFKAGDKVRVSDEYLKATGYDKHLDTIIRGTVVSYENGELKILAAGNDSDGYGDPKTHRLPAHLFVKETNLLHRVLPADKKRMEAVTPVKTLLGD
jgi:hypothetical protein